MPEPAVPKNPPKKKIRWSAAWAEARALIWAHRRRLAARPRPDARQPRRRVSCCRSTSKYLIDDVIGKHQTDLLPPLAWRPARPRSSRPSRRFALSQVLGVAAQRAITDMRKRVQAHVMRLPIRYFDSTKTGVLISRIMTDAEGIRNLVGTGLVQLTGGIVTAVDRARRPAST